MVGIVDQALEAGGSDSLEILLIMKH